MWDLLRAPWRLDTIQFENLILEDLTGLSAEGISWTLLLQWVSDGSVKVIIKHARATLSSICDISGEPYDREVVIKDFDARFSPDVNGEDESRVYDELFPLDPQWESITIYDLLAQGIRLQDPIVFIKPGKEHLWDMYAEDADEDMDLATGNVLFH